MSLAEDSRRVALQWVEYLNEGRIDDLMALGTPDATWWLSGLKETSPFTGTSPYAERGVHFKELFKVAISFKVTIREVITEGDTVVIEAGPRGEAKDGRIYVNDVIWKFVIKDGKIQSLKEYVDLIPLLKFAGGEAS
jgi:ketosteroid isomerase-like protein